MVTGTSRLLLDEHPLILLPSLAVALKEYEPYKGQPVNGAVVIQQVHYWIQKTDNWQDGHKWVYNSIPQWTEQFPFWSESSTRRTFEHLRAAKILLTGSFNRMGQDNTLWYRINYDLLDSLAESSGRLPSMSRPPDGHEQTRMTAVSRPLPEITTETSAEKSSSSPENFKKNEFSRVLSENGIWESLIDQINGNLNEEEIRAAIYLGRAHAKDEPTPYIAKLLRIWLDDEDAKQHGIESVRHVWYCFECDRFNYRQSGCHGFDRQYFEGWHWVIPRETE